MLNKKFSKIAENFSSSVAKFELCFLKNTLPSHTIKIKTKYIIYT